MGRNPNSDFANSEFYQFTGVFCAFSDFENIEYHPKLRVFSVLDMAPDKQQTLKPFDLVLAVKIAANKEQNFLIAELAQEFTVSVSTVHAGLQRAEQSGLISRSTGLANANRPALREFAIHGAKYAFPAALGRPVRGLATAIGAPVLEEHFESTSALVPVWPHPEGKLYGYEVTPLHPAVPKVAMQDPGFYAILALIDALRVGAAREREMAAEQLEWKI